jgi:hypothetical protein
MDIDASIRGFRKYLDIEKERQKGLKELSELLGMDFTFSDEEMIRNAESNFSKAIDKEIQKEIKSAINNMTKIGSTGTAKKINPPY